MKLVNAFLQNSAIGPLGWTLIHFLWQGAAAVLVLGTALFLLRRRSSQSRYVSACLAMLVMSACPLVTLSLLWNQSERASNRTPSQDPLSVLPAKSFPLSDPVLLAHFPIGTAPGTATVSHQIDIALPFMAGGWLVGVFALTLRAIGGWFVVRRLFSRNAWPINGDLADRASLIARQLGIRRAPVLLKSAPLRVPTVAGCFRAVILIPVCALTSLPPQQVEALLAHELAHVRRYDFLVNLWQTSVETLLFYHPAVWWVSRCIRIERENCCDDLAMAVLGDRLTYARALASLENLRAAQPALAANGGELIPRIRRILGEPIMYAHRFSSFAAAVTALSLLLVPAALIRLQAASASPVPQSQSKPAELQPIEVQRDSLPAAPTVTEVRVLNESIIPVSIAPNGQMKPGSIAVQVPTIPIKPARVNVKLRNETIKPIVKLRSIPVEPGTVSVIIRSVAVEPIPTLRSEPVKPIVTLTVEPTRSKPTVVKVRTEAIKPIMPAQPTPVKPAGKAVPIRDKPVSVALRQPNQDLAAVPVANGDDRIQDERPVDQAGKDNRAKSESVIAQLKARIQALEKENSALRGRADRSDDSLRLQLLERASAADKQKADRDVSLLRQAEKQLRSADQAALLKQLHAGSDEKSAQLQSVRALAAERDAQRAYEKSLQSEILRKQSNVYANRQMSLEKQVQDLRDANLSMRKQLEELRQQIRELQKPRKSSVPLRNERVAQSQQIAPGVRQRLEGLKLQTRDRQRSILENPDQLTFVERQLAAAEAERSSLSDENGR